MNTEIETQEIRETKSKGGRPKNPPAPTNASEARALLAAEVVRNSPDKDKCRFLSELMASYEAVEARVEKSAAASLPALTAERDTLLAKVAELQPIADKVPELETMKANMDEWRKEQVRLLTEEATQERFKAQRAEYAATEKLREAQSQFGQKGLQLLLDEVQKLVHQFSIPEPDPATLPNGISPLYLTLWGHSAIRSQLMIGYSKSFPEPNEAFKNTLLCVLRARLPLYEGTVPSDPVPEIDVKQAVLTAMARKWNVLEEIQKRSDDEAVQRQANFLRNHHAQMHSEEQDAARRGEGRSPIGEAEPASGVPLSEHLPMCVCKICSPNLRRPGSLDVIGGEESF